MNVNQDEAAGSLQLRVVDPIQGEIGDACTVVFRLQVSDVPCATNPRGACEVAFS